MQHWFQKTKIQYTQWTFCFSAYWSDISEKFSALNTSMQENDTNIGLNDKVKAFIGKSENWMGKVWTCSLVWRILWMKTLCKQWHRNLSV
jgi:hypothetical protein